MNPHKIETNTHDVKVYEAWRLALSDGSRIYRTKDGWEILGDITTVPCGSGSVMTRKTISLNPNVLDPEDAVAVARNLGAVLVVDVVFMETTVKFFYAWGGKTLESCDREGVIYRDDNAETLDDFTELRIHSIPQFNLRRC